MMQIFKRLFLRNLFQFAVIAFATAGAKAETIEDLLTIKASRNEGITQADDPALTRLGEAVIHFVRERDVKIYEAEVIPTFETMWKLTSASLTNAASSREEFARAWTELSGRVAGSARTLVEGMESAGIDFKGAAIQLKEVSIKELVARAGSTNLDGLTGEAVKITFTVASDAKSKTGKSVSGEYVFAAYKAIRADGNWFINRNVYWERMPEGVADVKASAQLELEKYVAANRSLPPETTAPDAEVIRVMDQQKLKLSSLRGKIVVLDFWATWCGPCQAPMANMQRLLVQHPNWKDRVELVTVSIDENFKLVGPHLERRGWTNTLNVWAGPGTWSAEAPRVYRVSGVPTTYLISADGKIVAAGLPEKLEISEKVDQLLNAKP